MPIDRLISTNINLTPEQRHALELAFNRTLRKLNLVDRNDPICAMVARNEIEMSGESNAVVISEMAFQQLAAS